MKYWPRWIGDWKKKTASLTVAEKGAYGELLDHAYSTEESLPADKADLYRICGAMTKQECGAVDKVLGKFFILSETGYEHQRVAEELAKRQAYSQVQRENARLRWSKPAKGNGEDFKPPAHFKPPDWVPLEQWNAWLEVRRRMKAPNTDRALKLAIKDLDELRAGGQEPGFTLDHATKKGWRGLFLIKDAGNGQPAQKVTTCRKCGTTESQSWIDGMCGPCWEAR